jgi:SAM-dependent methyltransferase
MAKKPTRRLNARTARTADKHDLYQRSVQSPDTDVLFFSRLYRRATGDPLRALREDFCGTALLSCHFVKLHRDNRALAIDLDAATLAWGRKHNLGELREEQRRRVELRQADVREVSSPRAEMTVALNFSYCIFKTRQAMLGYLRNARRGLVPGGLLLLDMWGGSETQVEQEEERRVDGFTYVWDQHRFDPLTYHTVCRIHFEFADGSRLRNAFEYDWRLWTIPEMREMLEETGFCGIEVLWEGTDRRSGEGNGVFRRVERGDADQSWIAYVLARA